MTHTSRYPLRRQIIDSEMPVLPDVGSSTILSGVSAPDASASWIIRSAMRSFIEPVGLWPSSFARIFTSLPGPNVGKPTKGVLPIAPRMSSARTRLPAGDRGEDRDHVAV